ncbi:retron St85 family RNA-directed DNA polymerase [Pleionea sp. CnH1-48]|uniref:retron St85 family RNA-directed DNA polymerase n=1 Tax=Pleionea sp. CnH1-48 TaxID=2954494 RepID=UPI0020980535|nr:retron St85 family RNA-directed DNA polymerase [Pleionea sp. CnH1-48]MCO7225108.1 retron St85 family RNA-directed DNA polymerase [Pleionea sp. CnH1-48]
MAETDNKKLTRQEIYQRIRETSKDEYILSEMKRLGFWPDNEEKPQVAAELIEKKVALSKELHELGKEIALYEDPEAALQALHKQRKKEALEKREHTRQERNRIRFEKAQAWHQRQQNEITYIGEGISRGLGDKEQDLERLTQQQLPEFSDEQALASAMGISLNELRFLCYKKKVHTKNHYQHFSIPKKTGGTREISAPMPRLKAAQYWILDNILKKLPLNDAAHGFIDQRSIVSNAQPHVDKAIVINLDLKDFFPTITFRRIKGVFQQLGYSEHIATLLASVCSEANVEMVELDGTHYFVATTEPKLPQGAPTSPALSNLLCRKMDRRLQGIANSLNFTFTRYADDLTFSTQANNEASIKKLLWRVRQVVKDEGFAIHPDKTRVMRKHKQQEVTGIVVNKKLSVNRKTLKQFRALLHQIDKDGPDGKSWGNGELFSSITGYANFVTMVAPEKGQKLKEKVRQIKAKYSAKPPQQRSAKYPNLRQQAAAGKLPAENWWQAKPKTAPDKELTAEEIKVQKQKAKAAQSEKPKPHTAPEEQVTSPVANDQDAHENIDKMAQTMKMIALLFLALLALLYFAS